ncbi:hypothetical protein HU718_016725 [Pseudomonas tensinigenes]|uniref:Uncharacterized protein n=1 Tax=Pseudomonas tensinigenes TaxID=2745511 RepID=A0ABX8PR53_9PSED|nr:hypothetical protein [Pseudomonas tensinigenes]QXI03681.1 hypothetical protein HU718_016725 [Pseudomonas tensinigenes]
MPPIPPPPPLPPSSEARSDSSSLMSGLSGLLALTPNPDVKNQWFNGQEVKLDGWNFISCRFDNCRLYLSSTEFSLENCFLDDRTVVTYSADLIGVVRLFNLHNDWIKRQHPYFAPTYNSDGTITVSKKS